MKNILLFLTVFLVFIYDAFADYRYVCRLSNTNDINKVNIEATQESIKDLEESLEELEKNILMISESIDARI